jgi:isopenicillin-N N-acyltransferase-like protein
MPRFKELTLSGTPHAMGLKHGKTLSREIRLALKYYKSIFKLPEFRLLELGEYYLGLISAYKNEYALEIAGIAEGANIDTRWVAVLNARTEILSYRYANCPLECTALFSKSTAILGQNWDWAKVLEDLVVVMKIVTPGGLAIRMLTEPGIVGKIGLNSAGLGVCLNILTINRPLKGLPIHIVLRSILESKSLDQAREVIAQAGNGKASNILVGDASGGYFSVEFAGYENVFLDDTAEIMLHTNHYLHKPINLPGNPEFASSYAREHTARQQISSLNGLNKGEMTEILSDKSNPDYPILRSYCADANLQELGTVCSIIMDLRERDMYIRKGNSIPGQFVAYSAV